LINRRDAKRRALRIAVLRQRCTPARCKLTSDAGASGEWAMRKEIITDAYDEQITTLLIAVLEAHKSGEISTRVAASGIHHVITAIDADETGEIEAWLGQKDLKFFRVAV
jgi:hypothetical protein